MRTIIRDSRILSPELKKLALSILILNGALVFLYGVVYLPNANDFLLNPLLMCIPLNLSIIIGFLIKYFSEWKREIQDAFDNLDRQEKYHFFSKRFEIEDERKI